MNPDSTPRSDSLIVNLPAESRALVLLKHGIGNALVFAIGLVFALIITECLARVIFYRSMDFDMEMWKYATTIKVASDDPNLGHEHRPNASALLMGVNITTDNFGLRGRDTTLEKPANTFRIVLLGDSLTLGWGVSQDDIFATQLERMLNSEPPTGFPKEKRYEVLNLGVGNYNTVQEVERLKKTGVSFNPDLIVLNYFINDAEPVPRPQRGFLIDNSYLYAFLASRLRTLPIEEGSGLNYEDYYLGLYQDGRPGWLAAQAALAELVQIGHERNVPVIMFILPELHNLGPGYPFLSIDAKLIDLGSRLGLPVVDLYSVFRGISPEAALWVSPTDAHPNARAHAIIADGIYSAITRGMKSR